LAAAVVVVVQAQQLALRAPPEVIHSLAQTCLLQMAVVLALVEDFLQQVEEREEQHPSVQAHLVRLFQAQQVLATSPFKHHPKQMAQAALAAPLLLAEQEEEEEAESQAEPLQPTPALGAAVQE
jgi:hypothetical protein